MSSKGKMDPATTYTCFAFDQIFVALDGQVMPCCLANRPLGKTDDDFRPILERKIKCNSDILTRNDASLCWDGCPSRVQNSAPLDPKTVRKVVFYTNTYCPLQCRYCSLAYAADAPEWEMDEELPDRGRSIRPGQHSGPVWMHQKPGGRLIQPVHVTANDNPKFLELVERMIPVARENHWWFEFSGGDSAYHPDFAAVLKRCLEAGLFISYLTSGVLPAKIEDLVVDGVKAGLVWPTISPDATTAPTWSLIKRRPARLFERVVNFVRRCTAGDPGAQIGIKYIVMRENLADLPRFVPFYGELGVKKFVLSTCRRQPVHFLPPVSQTVLRKVLADTLQIWATQRLHPQAQLQLIGFEEHCPQILFSASASVGQLIEKLAPGTLAPNLSQAVRHFAEEIGLGFEEKDRFWILYKPVVVDDPSRALFQSLSLQTQNSDVAANQRSPAFVARALQCAEKAYAAGQLTSACQAIREALIHAPKAVQLHACLGNIFFEMREYAKARDSYDMASKLQPDNVDVLVRLAVAALRSDAVELFESALGKALALDENNPQALRLLADTNFSDQRFEDALAQYLKLLEQEPGNVGIILLRGVCQFRLGQFNLAQESFEKVLAREPDNPIAAENLKVVLDRTCRGFDRAVTAVSSKTL